MGQLFIPEYCTAKDFNKADLVILRGQPGAGKTTWAGKFSDRNGSDYTLVEADQFFTNSNGDYIFRKDLLPQAHAWCLGEVRRLLKEDKKVIVANTFTRLHMLQPYIEAATDAGKTMAIIRIFACFHSTKPDIPRATVIRHIREYQDFTWERYDAEVLHPPVASKERLQELVAAKGQTQQPVDDYVRAFKDVDLELAKYIKR